jgi:hypothetical protein
MNSSKTTTINPTESDLEAALERYMNVFSYTAIRRALDRVVARCSQILPQLVWEMICDLVLNDSSQIVLAKTLRLVCRAFHTRVAWPLRRVAMRDGSARVVEMFGQTMVFGGDDLSTVPRTVQTASFLNLPLRHARPLFARLNGGAVRRLSLQVMRDQPTKDVVAFVDVLRECMPGLQQLWLLANIEHAALLLPLVRTALTDLRVLNLQMRRAVTLDPNDMVAINASLDATTHLTEIGISGVASAGAHSFKIESCAHAALTQLEFQGRRVLPTEIEQIAQCATKLGVLQLAQFPITDPAALVALEKLTTLHSLSLSWIDRVEQNDASSVWESLSKLRMLTSLSTHGLPSPYGLAAVTELVDLRSLFVLNVADVTEVSALSALTNLHSLRLSFVELNQALPELHSLPLSICRLHINLVPWKRGGSPSLAAIERLTNLRTLAIHRQKLPHCMCTDELFATSLARMSRLEALSLRGFPCVGLLTISTVAQLERMRWLRLSDVEPSVLVALHTSTALRALEIVDAPLLPEYVATLTQLRLLRVVPKNHSIAAVANAGALEEALPRCHVVTNSGDAPSATPFSLLGEE